MHFISHFEFLHLIRGQVDKISKDFRKCLANELFSLKIELSIKFINSKNQI